MCILPQFEKKPLRQFQLGARAEGQGSKDQGNKPRLGECDKLTQQYVLSSECTSLIKEKNI